MAYGCEMFIHKSFVPERTKLCLSYTYKYLGFWLAKMNSYAVGSSKSWTLLFEAADNNFSLELQ